MSKFQGVLKMFMLGMLKTISKTVFKYQKTPSPFTAHVEIEWQISFFSFGFACVSEVRHIQTMYKYLSKQTSISKNSLRSLIIYETQPTSPPSPLNMTRDKSENPMMEYSCFIEGMGGSIHAGSSQLTHKE